jgi:CO dehydrogenase maturation factor
MKIAVCGKGGSGKSTMVTLLANEALGRGYKVLAVDSDESNSGLYRMLGFDHPPVPLMELVGGKKSLQQKMGQPSVLSESQIAIKDIHEPYRVQRDGLGMVAIGKIMQSLEGCACPMGVLSREFLKKLTLQPNELAIADMEAGVEHFGRGVETSIDSVLIVVEPPLESVEVAQKIYGLAKGLGIRNIWAVLNKVTSDAIAAKAGNALQRQEIQIIGRLHFDTDLFETSVEGKVPAEGRAAGEIKEVMDIILSKTDEEQHQ